MHRKSLEAADKLKDVETSDGESREQSEHNDASPSMVSPSMVSPSMASPSMISPSMATCPSMSTLKKNIDGNQLQQQVACNDKMASLTPPMTASATIYNSVLSSGKCNIKEELRTSSIAALRAKAMEHAAKVHANTNKSNEANSLFPINSPNLSPSHYRHSPPSRHHVY